MSKNVILCVDDEQFVLDSLKVQLKEHFGRNYIYEFAESGQEALELIDSLEEEGEVVLLVISDWLMPGMRGDEFMALVEKKHPQIKVILLSGMIDPNVLSSVKKMHNLYSVLYKPWQREELINTICSALE